MCKSFIFDGSKTAPKSRRFVLEARETVVWQSAQRPAARSRQLSELEGWGPRPALVRTPAGAAAAAAAGGLRGWR